jgi:diadenosine tetraphosphate (Ap4A) HIT family hydrolase
MKILYFKNIRRDKLNNILYTNIYFYILVENYDQNRLYMCIIPKRQIKMNGESSFYIKKHYGLIWDI